MSSSFLSLLDLSLYLGLVWKEYQSLGLIFNQTLVAEAGGGCCSPQAHPLTFLAALVGKWFAYVMAVMKGSRNPKFVMVLLKLFQ